MRAHRFACTLAVSRLRRRNVKLTSWLVLAYFWTCSCRLSNPGFPHFCSEKFPGLFQDFPLPQNIFSGLSHTSATCKYRDKQKLLTTECLYDNCIHIQVYVDHCHWEIANSFQDLPLKLPGLSRTKSIFQDFPGPGNFPKKSRTFQEAWEPCKSMGLWA